jgi:hypothetical protein
MEEDELGEICNTEGTDSCKILNQKHEKNRRLQGLWLRWEDEMKIELELL